MKTIKLICCLILVLLFNSPVFAKSGIEQVGDFTQVIVPAIALGMALNEDGWEGTKQLALSFAASQATVHILKFAVDEERPDCSDNNSFPSGHTACAFAGATFIHKRYGFKKAILPYALASYTGFSRVYAEKHHVHDVLAGAAISAIATWLLVDEESKEPPKFVVSASPKSFYVGFNLKF